MEKKHQWVVFDARAIPGGSTDDAMAINVFDDEYSALQCGDDGWVYRYDEVIVAKSPKAPHGTMLVNETYVGPTRGNSIDRG